MMERNKIITLVSAILSVLSTQAQQSVNTSNTLAIPSAVQYEWQQQGRIMFVCIDPATWQGREYDNHSIPISRINPKQLSTDQWCRVAKSWGAKEILFVAKHTGGFCWWQTNTTNYGIRNTPWKNGKGDVLKELSVSCKKYGLNLGIYVSPADMTWEVGIGSAGKTKDPSKQQAYNNVYRQQLKEVLTRYGNINEVWFDGSCIIPIQDILSKYAKKAVVFQGPQATIRWVGNEEGIAPYPAWNTVDKSSLKTGVATAAQGYPDGNAWAPLECNTTLYDHYWFWSKENEQKSKNLNDLIEVYYKSIGRGATMLLNSTPDTTGLIPEGDVALYDALGNEIKRRFSYPLAMIKNRKGYMLEINFKTPTNINQVVFGEDYLKGERIRAYEVEGFSDGQWRKICTGSSVGRKRIDLFKRMTVSKVRLHITKSVGVPLIKSFAVYQINYPPDLALEKPVKNINWQYLNPWVPSMFKNGTAEITLNLTPYITHPGQYEVKFETNGKDQLKILHSVLLLEGEKALNQFLIQKGNVFHINRTAQVTNESSTVLKVKFQSQENESSGNIYIREMPLEK
jgi:alpha-L-fucosidase